MHIVGLVDTENDWCFRDNVTGVWDLPLVALTVDIASFSWDCE